MRLTMTLSLPQHAVSVARARHALNTLVSLTDVTDECQGQLAVLISEACGNAVRHALDGSTVDVKIVIDADLCLLEVGNRGLDGQGATITAELPDPLAVSGRGLPLIAALADTAAFVAAPPGWVLLRMTKRLR